MKIRIENWIKEYLAALEALFPGRLVFVGLQGSYGRGEATDSSDIDMVVILDEAKPEDLRAYAGMLDTLPNRDKACGFISGIRELENWERSDLFQFYYDTTPVFGSLDFLRDKIKPEDIRRAVRMGACNLYHACGHIMVHERSCGILKGLYKSAVFTVQAIAYLQTGAYYRRKADLLEVLQPPERAILETAMALLGQGADIAPQDFDRLSDQLFNWASRVIHAYAL